MPTKTLYRTKRKGFLSYVYFKKFLKLDISVHPEHISILIHCI